MAQHKVRKTPNFNTLSASLANVATEVAKMQNLLAVNFADHLNRAEQTQLRMLRKFGDRRYVGELRQDVNRAYVNAMTSTLLESIMVPAASNRGLA